MNSALRTSLFAAVAVAAGLGVARAGPDAAPAKLPIEGVVRDAQGRPIPAVWIEVEGWPKTLKCPPPWTTDVHGRFRTDDVPRGPVRLLVTAGKRSHDAKKRVVETQAGVRDLVIVLDPGPQLFLRIVGYVPGPRERGARVTWEDPDGRRDDRWAPIRDDGWVRFVALPPDREFELWARAEVDGRHVRARGLKPGESERRIEPVEVKDIAGRVRGSKELLDSTIAEARGPLRDHLRFDVYAYPPSDVFSGLIVDHVGVESDGSFRVRGLPPGTYTLSMDLFHGAMGGVSQQVEAGTTDLVIDLD